MFKFIAFFCIVLGVVCFWVLAKPENGVCALLCYNLGATCFVLAKIYGDRR